MKLTIISDTHNQHDQLDLPLTDVLIHAGDFTSMGRINEIENFFNWFKSQPHEHKIFVAGNHDFGMEAHFIKEMIPLEVVYLEDQSHFINDVHFYGSPWQGNLPNWAFYRKENARHPFLYIPPCDVLITHVPPKNYLDKVKNGPRVGSDILFNTHQKGDQRPKLHIFGHIHEERGIFKHEETTFVNASCLDERYKLYADPIFVVDLDELD